MTLVDIDLGAWLPIYLASFVSTRLAKRLAQRHVPAGKRAIEFIPGSLRAESWAWGFSPAVMIEEAR